MSRKTSGGAVHAPQTLTILSRVFDGLTPEEQWIIDRLYREIDWKAERLLSDFRANKKKNETN